MSPSTDDTLTELEREIRHSVQAYFAGCNQAYTTGKRDILHTVCAPEMVGFGTGAHEKAKSRDLFEDTLFGASDYPFDLITFRLQWIQIESEGIMATAGAEVDGEVVINGETSSIPPLRASFGFRLCEPAEPGQLPWQIIHLHYSFPDTQTENENIDMRALEEYNKVLEQRVEEKTEELRIAEEQRRKAEQRLLREMQGELEKAHTLQMGLMPKESPQIKGLEIAGRCMPASHVGGDFFQYFLDDRKLSICMADVTGHAMEAAVPVMMFSGILASEIKHDYQLDELLVTMNQTLFDKLGNNSFICITMVEVDIAEHKLHLVNGGCPYPYYYQAATRKIAELQVGAYPLGLRPQATYPVLDMSLQSGDYLVFCSDGIAEAGDPDEEIFGFGRTMATIEKGCREGISTEGLIDRLIGEVKDFVGDKPQSDDMTCVVMRVE